MNSDNISINSLNDDFNINDEIDLNQTLSTLLRNKKLIAKITSLGLIIGGLIAFTTKNTWRGDFQIVLEEKKQDIPIDINPNLARFTGIGNDSNQLETEVEILKSPSVLMDIFQYVKKKKIRTNRKYENLRFRKWMQNLNINLSDRTSILNISYKDKDKDLILPVLNKISGKYQKYSGRKRLRSFELGIDYFKNQLEIYKDKSNQSMLKADRFASDQNLILVSDKLNINNPIPFFLDVEEMRIKATAELKFIDKMMEILKSSEKDSATLFFIAEKLNISKENILLNQLQEIDSSLAFFRTIYFETDDSIKLKTNQKKVISDLLSKQITGILLSKEKEARSQLIESNRPEGIIMEYKRLLSEAARDNATFENLENEFRILSLEKARYQDPWELITNPTLEPDPVAPKKLRILVLSFFGGLFAAFLTAILKEKKENKIYTSFEFEKLSKMPLISEVNPFNKNDLEEVLSLLINKLSESQQSDFAFLKVGNIEDKVINVLQECLDSFSSNIKISIIENIKELQEFSSVVVLTQMGVTKRNEIIELRKKLNLQNKNIFGIFMLDQININHDK